MNKTVAVAAATVLLAAAASATVWQVPENRTTIQDAITWLAQNGDTVSV